MTICDFTLTARPAMRSAENHAPSVSVSSKPTGSLHGSNTSGVALGPSGSTVILKTRSQPARVSSSDAQRTPRSYAALQTLGECEQPVAAGVYDVRRSARDRGGRLGGQRAQELLGVHRPTPPAARLLDALHDLGLAARGVQERAER